MNILVWCFFIPYFLPLSELAIGNNRQTSNTNNSQTHTNHIPGHWDRWQRFRAAKKQQFQVKFRFQQGFLWFWKAACFPSQPYLTHTCFHQTWIIHSPSLYQTFHREFRLINKLKKKCEATFYATQRVWIILDSMKVEETPNLQVQPVRAALVLLHPACPCWEFVGNFQHLESTPRASHG